MSPDHPCLVHDGTTTTYAELDEQVTRLAHGLRARGVGPGDRVAFLGLNTPDLVRTLFATARLGAVFLPLNTRLAAGETAYVLDHAGAGLLLTGSGQDAVAGSAEVAATGVEVVPAEAVAPAGEPCAPIDEPVALDDLAMLQYTSGTTGRPKGVMLTHANITWNCVNVLVDLDLRADEVALVTAPLFHTAALDQLLLPTLLKGGTAVLVERFDPDATIDLVEQHGVTFLFGVTSMYAALSRAPRWETADLGTLRSAISGGAPLPASLLEVWAARGIPILQGYGLTEAAPGVTMLRADQRPEDLGSAGTPCFFTDVRVVAPDGSPVPVGEVGEVLVQGPHVTPGYWRDPAATAAVLDADGWLRTGDLARLEARGMRIVDRLKDMFISGGENVYPAEVEQAISAHPAVAECAVIGVPDERWGEVGRAVVTVRPEASLSPEELLAHLDGRLARYKIPRSVVLTDALPHNAAGKLLRTRVREEHGGPQQEAP